MASARAVRFVAPRRVVIDTIELREPSEREVLVRTRYSGISSGTELLAYRGELDPSLAVDETIAALDGTFRYPFRYGYSCVGEVERGGAGVPEGALVFAFQPHQDRFVASTADVVVLPTVDPRAATLFPLVETALQITLDAGPLLGEDVVVLGMGAVGILTAALITRAGGRVVGVDPLPWRRDAAAGLAVDACRPDDLDSVLAARGLVDGVPLVIEATGRPDVLASALRLLAHEGTALVASWYGTKEAHLPLGAEFHRRRLTIRSTQVSTIPARLADRWTTARRRAITRELLTDLPLEALPLQEFPFDRAADAFAALDRGDEGLIHVALCYG